MIKTKNPSLLLQLEKTKKSVFKWYEWYVVIWVICCDRWIGGCAMAGLECVNKEISWPSIILSFVKNCLSHAINILFAFVLALLEVYIWYHLLPSCLLIDLLILCSQTIFLLNVLFSSFSLFPILSFLELFELSSALFSSDFLLFVLFLLSGAIITLFYRSWVWILSSSSRIRLVI